MSGAELAVENALRVIMQNPSKLDVKFIIERLRLLGFEILPLPLEGPPMTEACEIEEIVARLEKRPVHYWSIDDIEALIADWRAKKAALKYARRFLDPKDHDTAFVDAALNPRRSSSKDNP